MSNFGTFSLADIARQAQDAELRREQITTLRADREAGQAEAERNALRKQAGMIAKLTEGVGDEATYQQRRQAALTYGIDPAAIPETYDPQFVQTYNVLATTLLRPDGERRLTNTAQELVEAGFEPGTPEFQRAMAQRITMQDSKVVNTTAGGMSGMLGPNGYQPFILPNPGTAQAGSAVGAGEERKSVGGRSFVKRGGQWFEETAASNGAGGFQP